MMNPVRTTTGWLAGRLIVFLIILAGLVLLDAYRDESLLVAALTRGVVPDKELVARLEAERVELEEEAATAEKAINARLGRLQARSEREIDDRIAVLDSEIAAREGKRLLGWRKAVALMTGQGLKEDLRNDLQIQLNRAERDVLKAFRGELAAVRATVAGAEQRERLAGREQRSKCAGYTAAYASRKRYVARHPILTQVPGSYASNTLNQIDATVSRWARGCVSASEKRKSARLDVTEAKNVTVRYGRHIESASQLILQPLKDLVEDKRAAVKSADGEVQRVLRSARKVFLQAFGILVLVTLAPVGIKAFWYWVVAPFAEKRPPIRLAARSDRTDSTIPSEGGRADKMSAVSQELTIGEGEELLVHPEFLQRSANQSRKDTKWLLSWQFPLTSIAARMVALDRLRVTSPQSFVVSSKSDPFAEVGIVPLKPGEMFVLQPRHLVGLVQQAERRIQIHRRWRFNWQSFITLQFRYLIFEGPGKLIVQGCRGVRLERAGSGRSIDQHATMGFSANLDYSPRRSETFSAYLLGTRALFNDTFAGGPGLYLYEEMPYAGKRAGITGRGLEGLTDALMKVVGI